MKIEAFKSNSGKLFETKYECDVENTTDDIYNFLKGSDEFVYMDMFASHRRVVIKDMAQKIVTNKEDFLKLFK